jgi:hypothetical protein
LHVWRRYSDSREGIIGWNEQDYRDRVAQATSEACAAQPGEVAEADVDRETAMQSAVEELANRNAERGFSANAWDLQACQTLERYEARIERRLRKLITQLQTFQTRRSGSKRRRAEPLVMQERSNKANLENE